MSLVGYTRSIIASECGGPVLLLAGQTLCHIFYYIGLALCTSVYIISNLKDVTVPTHSHETYMKITFKTLYLIVWRQCTIVPFIILLMSTVTMAFINITIEEAVLYHHEYCLYREKTKRRGRIANTMWEL